MVDLPGSYLGDEGESQELQRSLFMDTSKPEDVIKGALTTFMTNMQDIFQASQITFNKIDLILSDQTGLKEFIFDCSTISYFHSTPAQMKIYDFKLFSVHNKACWDMDGTPFLDYLDSKKSEAMNPLMTHSGVSLFKNGEIKALEINSLDFFVTLRQLNIIEQYLDQLIAKKPKGQPKSHSSKYGSSSSSDDDHVNPDTDPEFEDMHSSYSEDEDHLTDQKQTQEVTPPLHVLLNINELRIHIPCGLEDQNMSSSPTKLVIEFKALAAEYFNEDVILAFQYLNCTLGITQSFFSLFLLFCSASFPFFYLYYLYLSFPFLSSPFLPSFFFRHTLVDSKK